MILMKQLVSASLMDDFRSKTVGNHGGSLENPPAAAVAPHSGEEPERNARPLEAQESPPWATRINCSFFCGILGSLLFGLYGYVD